MSTTSAHTASTRGGARGLVVATITALLTVAGLAGPGPANAVTIGDSLTANDDSGTVVQNGAVWISLFDNDVAPNANPVSIWTISSPAHGGLTRVDKQTGLVEYMPSADFSGTDSFTYQITSLGAGTSNLATVTITVTPSTNTRPVGNLDSFTATSGVPTDVDVLANDTDPDGDALSLYWVDTQPSHGTAVVKDAAAGIVTYTPDAGYSGSDLFRYYAQDSQGALSNRVAVVVTVQSPTFSGTAPTVSGTPAVGQTLAAQPGAYTPADGVTIDYQWFRDAEAISGATTAAYVPVVADAGRFLRVQTTATRSGETVVLESESVAIAPVLLAPPTLAGVPVVGQTVTASTGTWGGANAYQFEVQWLRDGTPISGATAAAYSLTTADAGHQIGARVSGTRVDSPTVDASSTLLAVPAVDLSRPTFHGRLRVGKRLQAEVGTWAAAGYTFRYHWLRNGKPIRHATSARYRLRLKDRGRRVSVRVIAVRTGFATVTAVSAAKRVRR